MTDLLSLWLPIVLSAVAVFFLSFLLHMVLKYHQADFRGIPNEEAAASALRGFNLSPGDYMIPYGGGPEAMKDPDFIRRFEQGPVATIRVFPPAKLTMGPELLKWFIFSLIVSFFAAYIASRALDGTAEYLSVFRFAGATAFFCYAVGAWPESIWYKRPWSTTLRNTFDALVYALATGGMFGWLWPS